jgi:hypothetical protein
VHSAETVGTEGTKSIEVPVVPTFDINHRLLNATNGVRLANHGPSAFLEEASRSGHTIEGTEVGKSSGGTSEDLLVDFASKHTHDGAHTRLNDLHDRLLALVLELFFLGDDDGSGEVCPALHSRLEDGTHSEGNRLIPGGESSNGGVLSDRKRTLNLNAAILILNSALRLSVVKERNLLEELVDFAIANGEQGRR